MAPTRGDLASRSRLPLNSVRNRLVLLFFAITAAAVGFVYLYVVPQLRSSLTAEKLRPARGRGRRAGARGWRSAMQARASRRRELRRAGPRRRPADRRARDAARHPPRAASQPAFVSATREFERDAVAPRYVAAANAAAHRRRELGGRAGRRPAASGRRRSPLERGGETRWVAVLSDSLDEVDDNVALIRRQILIAGAIAIAFALLAGFLAARAHSRRLRRLERAAEKVAEGNFSVADPDRLHRRGRPARDDLQRDAGAPRAARQRAQGVHRQRLARAAHPDLLARRVRRAARARGARRRRRATSSCARCASRSTG